MHRKSEPPAGPETKRVGRRRDVASPSASRRSFAAVSEGRTMPGCYHQSGFEKGSLARRTSSARPSPAALGSPGTNRTPSRIGVRSRLSGGSGFAARRPSCRAPAFAGRIGRHRAMRSPSAPGRSDPHLLDLRRETTVQHPQLPRRVARLVAGQPVDQVRHVLRRAVAPQGMQRRFRTRRSATACRRATRSRAVAIWRGMTHHFAARDDRT